MQRCRVLVVDDSVVVRRLMCDALAADPELEVVGVASNGRIALAKLPQLNPDVLILDVEMPELDGLATLREVRKVWRRLPVIMFSTVTQQGASATVEALMNGADDYVTKPANVGSVTAALHQVRESLIPKIKSLCRQRIGEPGLPARRPAPGMPATPPSGPGCARWTAGVSPAPVEVVAVASSTGGPNALMSLMANWPADLPVPVVMVQHMPPMFTRMLAEHLSAKSGLRVVEATDAEALRPGQGYVAPGDHHMCLAGLPGNVRVRLHQEPHENSCRPSADVLFRSVAEVYGAHALAVVLTGMGQDGLRGSERIRDQGGKVLAQDEASSVVWGMAGAVVRAGLAEEIGPPSELSAAILRRVRHGRLENRARQPNLDRAVGAAA